MALIYNRNQTELKEYRLKDVAGQPSYVLYINTHTIANIRLCSFHGFGKAEIWRHSAYRRQVSKYALIFYENIVFRPRLNVLSFMLILAFLVNIFKVENADTTSDYPSYHDFDGVEAILEPGRKQ